MSCFKDSMSLVFYSQNGKMESWNDGKMGFNCERFSIIPIFHHSFNFLEESQKIQQKHLNLTNIINF